MDTLQTSVTRDTLALFWRVLQIRCGDLYADKAVEAFTACAVSDKKCVPQRVDESTFPVPPPCALDEKFDINNFQVPSCPSACAWADHRNISGIAAGAVVQLSTAASCIHFLLLPSVYLRQL